MGVSYDEMMARWTKRINQQQKEKKMAEKKKIELIKLTIQIGDSKVSVTKDEARDLYNALAEMFQVKKETVYVDRNRPWNWPYYGGLIGSSVGGLQSFSSTNDAMKDTIKSFQDSSSGANNLKLTYDVGNVKLSAAEYREND